MLNEQDFILHQNIRKQPRYPGEVNTEKRFASYCDNCNDFRGYIKKSHYYKRCKNTQCKKCISKLDSTKQKISDSLKNFNKQNPRVKSEEQVLKERLRGNLRNRLNRALKGNYKSGSAVRNLGCSIEELKKYLESKFEPHMSWATYGRKGWHIDHILPLSSYNLSDIEQVKQACHYTNLQPLWWQDNLKKSDKSSLLEV